MKPVHIKSSGQQQKKSKAQLKYENLLLAIEQQQTYIRNLQDNLPKTSAKIEAELKPIIRENEQLLRSITIKLDELANRIGLGKYNREWFDTYMAAELENLLNIFGYQDEVMANLYHTYAGITLDDIAGDEEHTAMAESLNLLFGISIDVKEFLRKGHQTYFEEHSDEFFGTKTDTLNGEDPPLKKRLRAKTAKQLAAESKAAIENSQLEKDAQSVYKRLIKKLHPDLEQDEALKPQKTALVQQVTKAYEDNDFFTLLKLQITHLDDNESDAAKIADDMLSRYNTLLNKQLKEQQQHIKQISYTSGGIVEDFIDKNGKFSPQKFAAKIRFYKKESDEFRNDLLNAESRPKTWFKEQMKSIKDCVQRSMVENLYNDMFNRMNF